MAKLTQEVVDQLNLQIQIELESAFIYKALSQWCSERGYTNSSKLFYEQQLEEQKHADKILKYIDNRNMSAEIPEISKPDMELLTLVDVYKEAFKHEVYVTHTYNELCDYLISIKDYITFNLAQWFANEQIEEEGYFMPLLDQVIQMGDTNTGLMLFDKELEI